MPLHHAHAVMARLDTAPDEHAILDIVCELAEEAGFDYVRLGLIIPCTIQRPRVVILNSCPTEWVELYTQSHYLAVDPIVTHTMRRSTPLWWADVVRPDAQCPEQGRAVMQAAQDWGLVDGLSFPWRGCAGHAGVVSFIRRQPLTPRHTLEAMPLLGWLTPYIFEALIRIEALSSLLSLQGSLSKREIEVCQWAAEGKQTSDIGRILGITARTITFHLNRVVEKLGASNKNQAMSWALKQGLVQLNVEAAPIINLNRPQSWQPDTDWRW
jgi:LuxR family quorum-sensing system transcriptional regulator SolR